MLLRPIFCEKLKIAPPHKKTASPETFEFPNLAEKSDSISAKTFFFFFFFWRPPVFGRKKPFNSDFGRKIGLNFGEDLFFLETTRFWAEKTFEFRISAEKSDTISAKTFFFETTCFWAEKTFEFRISAEKSDSISTKTFFFFFSEILGGKNLRISELSEKFRLNFRTNRVKLIQEQSKFGSRSSVLFSLFQNSPPFPNPGYAPGCTLVHTFVVVHP